jgi:hypothetical protein
VTAVARLIAVTLAGVALVAGALLGPAPARAGTLVLKSCSAFGDPGTATDVSGPVWQPQARATFSLANRCPLGGSFQIIPGGLMPAGENAQWHTVTPPSIGITGALTPLNDVLVSPGGDSTGFHATYFWAGGSQTISDSGNNCCGGMDYGVGINRNDLNNSRYFGFQVTCIDNSCNAFIGDNSRQVLDVRGIQLTGQDNTPPSVVAGGAGNVFYTGGREWIRGSGWPASFTASADDGICGMRVLVGGTSIQGQGPFARNQSSWTQCPTPLTDSYTLDTTQYPDGPLSLVLSAADAATPANVSSPSTTLHLDNTPVGLSLTGPSDVAASAANASTAITATASAGPSGAEIFCSVDGGPEVGYPGSSAQVPVSGLGGHQASCYAQNGAVDANGTPARSATQTFDLSIRQPTAEAVTFAHIADALRCQRVEAKVKVRGKTRVVKRHGKKILIRGRVRTVKKRVRRCHARTVKRKVWVVLKHHGKVVLHRGKPVRIRRVRRVVVLPHVVFKARQRIGHGKTTTVSGYLGLADGTPLANRVVSVIAAANNGLGRFALPIATVTTNTSGVWTVKVPAGPSRLIEAIYAGSATEEPVISAPVTLTVPARIRLLSVTPRVPWGGTVHLVGKLFGGYLPSGGVAIRMRYGYGRRARATFGVLQHIVGTGRFATTFTFGPGPARVHVRYWFSASLLANASYAFAAASSSRHYVRVGGHPKKTRPHHRKQRHHKHKPHH